MKRPTKSEMELRARNDGLQAMYNRMVEANDELLRFIEEDSEVIDGLEADKKALLQEVEFLKKSKEFALGMNFLVIQPGQAESRMVTSVSDDHIIFDWGALILRRETGEDEER